MKFILRQVGWDVLVFAVLYAVLGMTNGIVISSYQKALHSLINTGPYQNFALLVGMISGVSTCLVAFACYLLCVRFWLHSPRYNFKLYILLTVLSGAVTCSLTYFLVTSSGNSYGMAARTVVVVVIDGVISAIIGAAAGALIGIVVAYLRSFEKRFIDGD